MADSLIDYDDDDDEEEEDDDEEGADDDDGGDDDEDCVCVTLTWCDPTTLFTFMGNRPARV